MPAVTSNLSHDQEKKLLSLFGQVRLHLLYKGTVHDFTDEEFHDRCDNQGPTVIAAFNAAGYVYGAYTSKDYTQSDARISDGEAFLYSIPPKEANPVKVPGITGQPTFTDGSSGPDFGALVFLEDNEPKVLSRPGTNFNFEAADMHGEDLDLTELEVYRVEDLGSLLKKPWRNIKWTSQARQNLMQDIVTYRPSIKAVPQARILLVGPVGAGKSSFFNSINSLFRGNMTCQAISGTSDKSVTTQFRTYCIREGKSGKPLPLVLCDTMGLEEMKGAGLDLDDLVNIFKGHIADRYQFSPSCPLMPDSPGYMRLPTLNNMIHCIAYVVDTCKASIITPSMLEKFTAIRKQANRLGIPQLLLMTKVDVACSLVAENLKTIYDSVYIQRKAQELSQILGIPMSCVIPVKNYCEELEPDHNTEILLLMAVKQMLNYADSFFENQPIYDQDDLNFKEENSNSLTIDKPNF